jgi:formimidoylglutamate deiminase
MSEKGWLPDLLYRNGHFDSGTAMFVNTEGRITRFSQAPEDLRAASRLPRRAILPGLVNAHSHSFQRAIRARTEHRTGASRDSFWTWREAMYHAANALSPEDIGDVARMAFLEMLATGITTVGEFHYLHHAPDGSFYDDPNLLAHHVLQAARDTGLRIALLRTAYVRAGWQKEPNPGQFRFITPEITDFINHTEALRSAICKSFAPEQAWVGIAPHSIRAVPLSYLEDTARYARSNGLKLHMHVAEQPAEIEACTAEYGLRPFQLLQQHQVLGPDFTGVHSIHINEEEISHLGKAGSRVCACGTTERNLGDGTIPAKALSQAQVGICFGSDSNIQIDLLEDARELEYHLRMKHRERSILAPDAVSDSLARRLFLNATVEGAASLDAPGGRLEEGLTADFLTVDLNDLSVAGASPETLLSHIVFSLERTGIREVFVGGNALIVDGRHALQDAIVQRFQAVQQKLWGSFA